MRDYFPPKQIMAKLWTDAPSLGKIRFITSFLFVLSLVTFPNLWLGSYRFFPRVSLVGDSPVPLTILEPLSWVAMIICLFLILLGRRMAPPLIALTLCWIFFFLTDVLRLQVFYYWYLIVLFSVAFEEEDNAKNTLRSICVGLYFWAGLSKLNLGFASHMFPWLIGLEPGGSFGGAVFFFSIAAACFELGGGLLLLFPPTQRIAKALLIVMHLSISLRFTLAGFAFAPVIPWNILQIFILFLLFPGSSTQKLLLPKSVTGFAIRTLVFVLPALSCWGVWDDILSFRVFSGSALQANLIVKDDFIARISPKARRLANHQSDGSYFLPIPYWSLNDSNHQFLSEYYFKNVYSEMCKQYPELLDSKLVINHSLKYRIFFYPQEDQDKIYECESIK